MLAVVAFFTFRNTFLRWSVQKVCAKFEQKYNAKFTVEKSSFKGLSTVDLNTILLQSPEGDTVLYINELLAKVKLLPLFLMHFRLDEVLLNQAELKIIKTAKKDNISFLLKSKKEENDTLQESKSSINFGSLSNSILNTVFDVIPNTFNLYNSQIAVQRDTAFFSSTIDTLAFKDGNFACSVLTTESKGKSAFEVSGMINKSGRALSFTVCPLKGTATSALPVLKSFFNLSVGFDTLYVSLENTDYSNDELQLQGQAFVKAGHLHHWRLSPQAIDINYAAIDYRFLIGQSSFALDSTSKVKFNKMQIEPYVFYQKKPDKFLAIDFRIPLMPSQDFFESLPNGLFQNIEGIKTIGELGFKLHFELDTKMPDSVQFVCSMPKNKFKIIAYGESQLNKLNGEFLYTVYEKGRAVRSFMVGPSNPDFTPLSNISMYLQSALMTSEDGNFYSHNGFNENAFRKSIAENYKQGRFARGGSTISMQLVKNVFLTRNKTIARKAEEALLVWLIESNRIASKERMYEVYLNIIEWGPGIYGAAEASRYYFNKKPSDLSLAESIYLAMIVPRPKWFKYNFDEFGKLKPHVADYYRIIANHLVKKEIITEQQQESLVADIEIKGIAKDLILKPDTLALDSLDE